MEEAHRLCLTIVTVNPLTLGDGLPSRCQETSVPSLSDAFENENPVLVLQRDQRGSPWWWLFPRCLLVWAELWTVSSERWSAQTQRVQVNKKTKCLKDVKKPEAKIYPHLKNPLIKYFNQICIIVSCMLMCPACTSQHDTVRVKVLRLCYQTAVKYSDHHHWQKHWLILEKSFLRPLRQTGTRLNAQTLLSRR